jgi:hypothetical protein
MRRACGANGEVRGAFLALADREGTVTPSAASPSRQRITGRPRRTIGRLRCPIARTLGVRYAGGGDRGATRTRSRSAVLRGPGAARLWSLLPSVLTGALGGLDHGLERGTARPAGRQSRGSKHSTINPPPPPPHGRTGLARRGACAPSEHRRRLPRVGVPVRRSEMRVTDFFIRDGCLDQSGSKSFMLMSHPRLRPRLGSC